MPGRAESCSVVVHFVTKTAYLALYFCKIGIILQDLSDLLLVFFKLRFQLVNRVEFCDLTGALDEVHDDIFAVHVPMPSRSLPIA